MIHNYQTQYNLENKMAYTKVILVLLFHLALFCVIEGRPYNAKEKYPLSPSSTPNSQFSDCVSSDRDDVDQPTRATKLSNGLDFIVYPKLPKGCPGVQPSGPSRGTSPPAP